MSATVWQILNMSEWNDWKRKLCESAEPVETSLENFVKSHQVNLFLAGFSHSEPLCERKEKSRVRRIMSSHSVLDGIKLEFSCPRSSTASLNAVSVNSDIGESRRWWWLKMTRAINCQPLVKLMEIQIFSIILSWIFLIKSESNHLEISFLYIRYQNRTTTLILLNNEMVFCYQDCSDLLWKKNVLLI